MFNLIYNLLACAFVLVFIAVEQAKIKSGVAKRDLLVFSVAVAVGMVANSAAIVVKLL